MNKNYLYYSPEKKPKGTVYWQVWEGLPFPRSTFKRETLEDAVEAWSYSRNGFSIWVPPGAVRALKECERPVFIATAEQVKKGGKYKTEIRSLRRYEGNPVDAKKEAMNLNCQVAKYCNRKYRRAK